ncbi:MAG: hypothetical protein QW177_04635 [Candidatus Nitrosotenuis sp.]
MSFGQTVYRLFFAFLIALSMFYVVHAFAEEPRFATYHEIASVIVDQRLSNNVTASVSLQTTSIKEFQIPPDLDLKIRNNTDIVAVVITNEDQCVLGVQEQICVMINTKRTPDERGITAIQQKAKQAGDSLIGDINSAFGLDAKFHSVFIHYDDKSNRMLETTGEVSGAGTVSAVYTMPLQNTDYLFNKISGVLIPRQIREFGGFYLVATELARDDDSRMTFTILPKDEGSIMQLKVSKRYPHVARDLTLIDPLQYLKVSEIKKSDYFSVGFFPLNSLVYVVILPHDNSTKAHPHGNVIEATIKNNEKIPSDLTKSGWFFNSESAQKIEAMYLFGEKSSATKNDLMLTLADKDRAQATPTADYEIYLLIGIGAAAAAAAAFYFKGFKSKKSDN